MQLSQTVRHFWQFTAGYAVAAILVSVVHAVLFGWPVGLVAFGVVIFLFLGIICYAQPLFVPYRVHQWEVEPVSLLDWPEFDWGEVEALTEELLELGFVPLQDYSQRRSTPGGKLIARCFGNHHIGSFAEVGFYLKLDTPTEATNAPQAETAKAAITAGPVETTDNSSTEPTEQAAQEPDSDSKISHSNCRKPRITHTVFFSVFNKGWMLIDGNFAPQRRESLIYAWRNPREVRHYYPAMGTTQLCEEHLGHRDAMMRRLGIAVDQAITWDAYREIQKELITQPWLRLRRRNLLTAMLDATQFEKRPTTEWLGEYREVLNREISKF